MTIEFETAEFLVKEDNASGWWRVIERASGRNLIEDRQGKEALRKIARDRGMCAPHEVLYSANDEECTTHDYIRAIYNDIMGLDKSIDWRPRSPASVKSATPVRKARRSRQSY